MSFSNLILTNRGNDLMGKVVAGGTLQFNRIGIGDGTWPSYDPSMEALVSGRVSFPIQSVVTDNDGLATISAIMLHDHLISVGFYSREIGVFAQDPDLGEILYAMAYAGDEASWIPASTDATAYQHVYTIGINIGTSTSVVVQADPSVVTITLEQMNAHEALELDPTDTDPDKVRHLSNAQANGWETDIAANASAISAHASSTAVHGATSAATPNRIIIRDAAGRAKVSAPSASDDIARKADVDAEVSSRTAADSAHAALTNPHSATAAATPNRLILRDGSGRAKVAAPSASDDIARKADVDAAIAAGTNLIINPQFTVNQLGWVSGGSLSAGEYFYDQWRGVVEGTVVTRSGETLTIAVGGKINQPIEKNNLVPNDGFNPSDAYTLSWEGTASGQINEGALVSSPHTFNLPADDHLQISFTAGTLRRPVLVRGTTPMRFSPRKFCEEVALCQRYFCKSYNLDVKPGSAGPGAIFAEEVEAFTFHNAGAFFPVSMFTVPAITIYSIYGIPNGISDGNDGTVRTVIRIERRGQLSFRGVTTDTLFNDLGHGVVRAEFHFTADARIY